ncbi:MAG: hypothetical protein ACI4I9_01635 [Porcipelethomonas sp.]
MMRFQSIGKDCEDKNAEDVREYLKKGRNLLMRMAAEKEIGNLEEYARLEKLRNDILSLIYKLDDNMLIATMEFIYFTDKTLESIAEETDCSVKTVQNRERKALKILEDIYGRKASD